MNSQKKSIQLSSFHETPTDFNAPLTLYRHEKQAIEDSP